MADFSSHLLHWYDRNGRSDLPWQHPRSPYRVWLSEIMLQQTQVATVIGYFDRFVAALPSLDALAAAHIDDVLALWSGLGYYSRARNLHRTARTCVEHHGGELPREFDALVALPGIGRSTAGAILAQAWSLPFPILDGNVKRVLARVHGVRGWPGESATERELWRFAAAHTPGQRVADYTQAIMDLGATLCTRAKPRCVECPVQSQCIALRDGLTAELPTRRRSRARPTRATIMLILRDRSGRVLLERRAPTGIWAGLWSLPETDDSDSARREIARENAERESVEWRALPAFSHDFTHFRLDIKPIEALVEAHAVADDGNRRWLFPLEASALGLPAPVRKLIASLS